MGEYRNIGSISIREVSTGYYLFTLLGIDGGVVSKVLSSNSHMSLEDLHKYNRGEYDV